MRIDKGGSSNRFHITSFRKLIRDERTQPRLRFQAQLFLAYLEGKFPKELIESILEAQYGRKSPEIDEVELQDKVDKKTAEILKQSWQELTEENGTINTTN